MKCLRCGPLIKAIDAYLAKAENDLYEQLTMEGYLKAKESLNTVDEIEEVVTKLLEDNADDLLKELADAIDLETFFKDNWPKFKISIHALREEGDELQKAKGGYQTISIHALREEGDPPAARQIASISNFYPRPPRGGRL